MIYFRLNIRPNIKHNIGEKTFINSSTFENITVFLKFSIMLEKIVVSLDDIRLSAYKGITHIRPWELNQLENN